jgi:hypothetical protein
MLRLQRATKKRRQTTSCRFLMFKIFTLADASFGVQTVRGTNAMARPGNPDPLTIGKGSATR